MIVRQSLMGTTHQGGRCESDQSASEARSWLGRALHKFTEPCFGRVNTMDAMQTKMSNSVQLKNIGYARMQAHFWKMKEDRHKNPPLLNAVFDHDVPQVSKLLQQGHRADITPVWFSLTKRSSSTFEILDLLEKHSALPQGVTPATLKLVLLSAGNTDIDPECLVNPGVNINGFPGLTSPIRLATRFLPCPELIAMMINLGARDRPLTDALTGMSAPDFYLSNLYSANSVLKRIDFIDDICEKKERHLLIAEMLFLNANENLLKFIEREKTRPEGRKSDYFSPFLSWAAKCNKHEIFQESVFCDVFSSFPRAAHAAALVAGVYGRTEFLLTALRNQLLTAKSAIDSVGKMAIMGNISGIREMLKFYPECVVGCGSKKGSESSEVMKRAIDEYPGCLNAMYFSIRGGHSELVDMLLHSGAHDMSASLHFDDSLLHWAIKARQPNVVEVLLRPGVNIDHKNIRKETALDIAIASGFDEGVRLLEAWENSRQL